MQRKENNSETERAPIFTEICAEPPLARKVSFLHEMNIHKLKTSHQAVLRLNKKRELERQNYSQVVLKHIDEMVNKAREAKQQKATQVKERNELKKKKHIELFDRIEARREDLTAKINADYHLKLERSSKLLRGSSLSPSNRSRNSSIHHQEVYQKELQNASAILSRSRGRIGEAESRRTQLEELRNQLPRVSARVQQAQTTHQALLQAEHYRHVKNSVQKLVSSLVCQQESKNCLKKHMKCSGDLLRSSISKAQAKRDSARANLSSGFEGQQSRIQSKVQQVTMGRNSLIENRVSKLRSQRQQKHIVATQKVAKMNLEQNQKADLLLQKEQQAKRNFLSAKVKLEALRSTNLYKSSQLIMKLR